MGEGPGDRFILYRVATPGRLFGCGVRSGDTLGDRVGFQPGEARWNKLRHGYATAQLQTLDNGAPVSTFTVARGAGSYKRAARIYGHLGAVRHRSEVVEFRVEQHPQQSVPLLATLRA